MDMPAILRPMKKRYSICALIRGLIVGVLIGGLPLSICAQEGEGAKAILPKGTILLRLKDDKKVTLRRETYVNVLKNRLQEKEKFVVIDKQGNPLYTVLPDQVVVIEQVADLFKRPTNYQEYIPLEEEKQDSLKIAQEFSLAFYRLGPGFLDNIRAYGGEDISGIDLFYQWFLDFNSLISLGGQINYSTGTASDADEQFKMQRLTLGPVVSKFLMDFDGGGKIALQIGTLRSIFFSAKHSKYEEDFPFSSQSLKMGLQLYAPGVLADFTFGIHLSREFISPVIDEFPKGVKVQAVRETQLSLTTGVAW